MKEIADVVAAGTSGERVTERNSDRFYPTHDEIALLAYSVYESRGRQEGHQMEDWLRAEQQLVDHYA